MKYLETFFVAVLLLVSSVQAQEFCRPILKEARTALGSGNLDLALEKLQDATTCDFQNSLHQEVQQLERQIFAAIQQQKRAAVLAGKIAEEQRVLAEDQRRLAEQAREEAENQRKLAQAAEKEAGRQQMLTVCRSMALKSRYTSDKRMKSLLSLQAFRFYRRDSVFGNQHNGAIFEALYNARKALREDETNRLLLDESLGRHELAFSQSGTDLFWSSPQGNVYRIPFGETAFQTNTQLAGKELLAAGRVHSVEAKLHPAGDWAAYLVARNKVQMVDLRRNGVVARQLDHSESIRYWGFNQSGSKILISGEKGMVWEWDFDSNKIINQIDFREVLKEVALDPIEGRMYACAESGALLVQGLGNRIERIIDLGSDHAESLAFKKEGEYSLLAVGTREGRIYLFSLKAGGIEKPLFLRKLDGHKGRITSLDFSHAEGSGRAAMNYLASASMDETVRLWDLSESGKYELPIVLDDYQSWVWQLRFSPDNRFMLAVAHNGWLRKVPLQMEYLAADLCSGIQSNFTEEEWKIHVSRDWIPWEPTCLDHPLTPQKE